MAIIHTCIKRARQQGHFGTNSCPYLKHTYTYTCTFIHNKLTNGSTTAALIYLLHTLIELLQNHDYVYVIALDFSKAFDTVKSHFTLVSKLANFTLQDYLHNWIAHNLSCRQHQTKVNGITYTIYLCLVLPV